jgi:hypothetical protein
MISTISSIVEAAREHHRLGAAVAAGGEQFERAAASSFGRRRRGRGIWWVGIWDRAARLPDFRSRACTRKIAIVRQSLAASDDMYDCT